MYNLLNYKQPYEYTSTSFRNLKPSDNNRVYNNILECIGNTPLVKLNVIPKEHGLSCQIFYPVIEPTCGLDGVPLPSLFLLQSSIAQTAVFWFEEEGSQRHYWHIRDAKCEFMTPTDTTKIRIAHAMVNDAIEKGVVKKDTTFLESTSGNTGTAIAFVGSIKDQKCIIVTGRKNSDEKVNVMRLLGANVIRTENGKSSEVAERLKDKYPDTIIMFDQFDNPVNPITHYKHTAEEIIEALDDVSMIVAGAGTGGTLSGIGHRLKERSPKCITVAAEPDGSVMFNVNGKKHSYLVEGIGGGWIPMVCDKSVVDSFEVSTDQESFLMARDLAKKEGLLCGGSSGCAMVCALKAAKKFNLGPNDKVVVILSDSIRNYMSKFVSEQWMEAHLFLDPPDHTMNWWKDPINLLTLKQKFPVINDTATCTQALSEMNKAKVDLAVVIDNKGWFLGVVSKDNFRNLATNPMQLPGNKSEDFDFKELVSKCLVEKCYKLAENGKKGIPTIGLLSRVLDITPFVVIGKNESDGDTEFFIPEGVATGEDVLEYIYKKST